MKRIVFFLAFALVSWSCVQKKQKLLVDVGDSLTAGAGGYGISMSSVASSFLGSDWEVLNMGVGGENTLTIGARFGAMPMFFKDTILITKNDTLYEISQGLFSSYNGKQVNPLRQGKSGIKSIYINDKKYVLEFSKDLETYFISRTEAGDNTIDIIMPNTLVETELSKIKSDVTTIFIGQNNGYETPEDYMKQLDLFVEKVGHDQYIIITSHLNCKEEIRLLVKEEYGDKYIDLKNYFPNQAIYDAIELGLLEDDGTYPTEEDLELMTKGRTPKSLTVDGVHFNKVGYTLLGRLRYQKGKELGYW